MPVLGWQYPFRETSWSDVRKYIEGVYGNDNDHYLLNIIDSVLESGADEVLAVATSMADLLVAPKPACDAPLDVVIVCAPGSIRDHPAGTVRIDHLSAIGKGTQIIRPAEEAVPLLWRFLEVEFGVRRRSDGPESADA